MTYPADPNGDMVPILEASIAVAEAMQRHPSSSGFSPGPILKLTDRCDKCGAAAMYRVWRAEVGDLDYCQHHWNEYMPTMADQGWQVIGTNPDLVREMYGKRPEA